MEFSSLVVDSVTALIDFSTVSTLLLMLVNFVSNSDLRAEVAALTWVSIRELMSVRAIEASFGGGAGELFFTTSIADSIDWSLTWTLVREGLF